MKITSRPELPCEECVTRLLAGIPAGTPDSAEFQSFSFCDHNGVMFALKQTALGQQWAAYSPATLELLDRHVELQRMINRVQKEWLASNMPPAKLQ